MQNTWDSLSEREQLLSMYSDCYKDMNGFRPTNLGDWTVEDLRGALNRLQEQLRCDAAAEASEADYEVQVREAALTRQEWTLGDFWSEAVKS